MIDTEFRDLLVTLLPAVHIQQGFIDQSIPLPFVWFNRDHSESEGYLSDEAEEGERRTDYGVEVVSDDLEEASAIVDILYSLNTYQGALGAYRALGIDVIFIGETFDFTTDANEGRNILALNIHIISADN